MTGLLTVSGDIFLEGLVARACQVQWCVQGMLRPLPPASALDVLKRKWEHHFDKQVRESFEWS